MNLKRIIANNIYLLRSKHKLTQGDFAKKLGGNYSRGYISHIELGRNMPSAEFIYDVSKAFNVDINWLLQTNIGSYPNIEITIDDIELALRINRLPEDTKEIVKTLLNYLK